MTLRDLYKVLPVGIKLSLRLYDGKTSDIPNGDNDLLLVDYGDLEVHVIHDIQGYKLNGIACISLCTRDYSF